MLTHHIRRDGACVVVLLYFHKSCSWFDNLCMQANEIRVQGMLFVRTRDEVESGDHLLLGGDDNLFSSIYMLFTLIADSCLR